ncbi:MAG: class I SAM-dependent methyltransferase [Polyangiales bacterium]
MNTLEGARVADVVRQLYADADATQKLLRERLGQLSPQLRASSASADYRALYAQARDIHMPVSPATGTLLYMLARGNGARVLVEFGTSFGLSTLHLAAALRDNGGGQLIGSEFEPSKIAHAHANLERGGLLDLVEIREGDALETLRELPTQVDGLLLDGHKPLYAKVLALVAPRLRPGAFIIADNADMCPEYVQAVRAPGSGYLSIPFADDVELTVRT